MRKIWAMVGAASLFLPAAAGDGATAAALRDRALTDPTAWNVLESLSYEVGPRPVGTPAYERARDWAVAKFKELGFTDIKIEPFAKPSWKRGAESAEIVGPHAQKLTVVGLGGSIPTPKAGIEAEIVVLNSLDTLLAAGPDAYRGKIVVIDQPMVRAEDGAGYGAAVRARYAASDAAKRGAVAYLVRSIATGTGRAPHTGHTTYAADAPKIPCAALGAPDADLLVYLAAKGPVRIRLKLASAEQPKTTAWTISGEIRGSGRADEVVVIGGHIDSWDAGLGAIDDAAGVAITAAAAKLIGDLPNHPSRTIRVVMWGSEETGGSSEAYLKAHQAELPKIVATSESDLGADRAIRIKLPKGGATVPALAPLADLLAPLRVLVSREPAEDAGADVEDLVKAGVPAFAFEQDASRYFDYHHSADDTPAIVDRAQLDQNVAAWTTLLYLLADSDADLRIKSAK
jgi:Iap family predicted aminopeptidase